MSFERKMKKHIDATMNEQVPNPYQKKHSFPLWAKIATPIGGALVAACITLAIVLTNAQPVVKATQEFLIAAPKAKEVQNLSSELKNRTAVKTLENLDPYFAKNTKENYVLSPASYLLALSSLVAVSTGFDEESFGLDNAQEDTKALLESWNFFKEDKNPQNPSYCRFDSGVLHQQVGSKYAFDASKQKDVADEYIATSVASLNDYHKQAEDYFHKHVGLSIPIPDPHLRSDGVITYGAFKMKEYIPDGLGSEKNLFWIQDGITLVVVDSYQFGAQDYPFAVSYYKGANYQAFNLNIVKTSLLIVLPDEGTSINDISISEAYASYMENREQRMAYGYVPYFHILTQSEDLTNALKLKLTGSEVPYDKLLKDNVKNDLQLNSVLQTSDFEFNQYGVAGESITVISYAGSVAPDPSVPIELSVDRPFYAISLKDGFPLFVNKVINPNE